MLIKADALHIPLRNNTVQCVVTSPPYWMLRDYGLGPGALGAEETPKLYVRNLVRIFREVRRVLRPDGTLWLNLGDSYASKVNGKPHTGLKALSNKFSPRNRPRMNHIYQDGGVSFPKHGRIIGLKPKDLVGIPWRVALALQADGWYLRSDIIWSKPNPMPESVTDRPTKAHEYVFLLAKSERYYFNQTAVRECYATSEEHRKTAPFVKGWAVGLGSHSAIDHAQAKGHKGSKFTTGKTAIHQNGRASETTRKDNPDGRNIRTIWTIAIQPYSGSHFATFPETLAERCLLAGSKPGDLVLDPFGGSGTVGRVAERLNRRWVHMDLTYQDLAIGRTTNVQKELTALSTPR